MSELSRGTLGGGCFWCLEAAFKPLNGVQEVLPGYAGGCRKNPTYEAVCSGNTDHAEVVDVRFDSNIISYRDLLDVFFTVHDPTQLNRQGPDVGPQYRSIILYRDENQKNKAEQMISELEDSGRHEDPIVTEIEPLNRFWEAEEYHHDYFEKNPNQAYCRSMIPPKLEKLKSVHDNLLPENS